MKRTTKMTRSKGIFRSPAVEDLRPEEAAEVLRRLLKNPGDAAEAARTEIGRVLGHVDPDALAAEVFDELEALDVQELWDRSGPRSDGYHDPADMSWEMTEEALIKYVLRMKQYHEVGKEEEGDRYTLGLLKGIYDFDHKAETEFKKWGPDCPGEAFTWVLDEWKRCRKRKRGIRNVERELADRCPGWCI